MAYPTHIDPIERQITDEIIHAALNAGLLIAVRDEDNDTGCGPTNDRETITAEVAASSMTYLKLFRPEGERRQRVGTILLVHGNGVDVISDCSDNVVTTGILSAAEALAEELGEAQAMGTLLMVTEEGAPPFGTTLAKLAEGDDGIAEDFDAIAADLTAQGHVTRGGGAAPVYTIERAVR